MSKHLSTPFRFDYVGSFLRPARLKEARQKFSEQAISADELKAVEDDCIRELVAKQKAAGYHVITDGEFRRTYFHIDFLDQLESGTAAAPPLSHEAEHACGSHSYHEDKGGCAGSCH